jgi:hypothetical protein
MAGGWNTRAPHPDSMRAMGFLFQDIGRKQGRCPTSGSVLAAILASHSGFLTVRAIRLTTVWGEFRPRPDRASSVENV